MGEIVNWGRRRGHEGRRRSRAGLSCTLRRPLYSSETFVF